MTTNPVPELVSGVQPEPTSIEVVIRVARKLLGADQVDLLQMGLCHRPVSSTRSLLLIRLSSEQTGVNLNGGVWVSAGHGYFVGS
jgi:hypothetical protein